MKKLFSTIAFILLCMGLSGQSNNEERLQQIPSEIDKAVEAGNYNKAAELKQEREIRTEIKAAIANGDFDKAAELKAELEGNPPPQTTGYTNTPKPKANSTPGKSPVAKSSFRKITKNGLFMELLIGFGSYSYDRVVYDPSFNTAYGGYTEVPSAIIGLKLGNKFYFGGKTNRWRIGVNMHWMEFGILLGGPSPAALINPLNPGLGAVFAFTEKIGMEANVNFGASVLAGDDFNGQTGVGIGVVPQVKFRLGTFAVGIEANFLNAINEPSIAARTFGFTAGFKF